MKEGSIQEKFIIVVGPVILDQQRNSITLYFFIQIRVSIKCVRKY